MNTSVTPSVISVAREEMEKYITDELNLVDIIMHCTLLLIVLTS